MLPTEFRCLLATAVVVGAAMIGGAYDPQSKMVVGLAFAVLLAWLAAGEVRLLKDDWIGLGLLLWAMVAAVTRGSAAFESKVLIATWIAAWIVGLCCRRGGEVGRRLSLFVIGTGAIVLATAVILESIGAAGPVEQRPGGLLVNPNVVAALIVAALPIFWLLPQRWRPLTYAAALFAGGALLMTGSRAAILAVGAALIFAQRSSRARTLCVLAVVGGATILIGWRLSLQPDSLAWHRPAIWRALGELVAENPVAGLGPGGLADATGTIRITHSDRLAHHQHRIGSAESTPIGILVRLGGIGTVICGGWILMWLARAAREGFFKCAVRRSQFAAIITICLFHDVLEEGIILWWWAMLLGLADGEVEDRSSLTTTPTHRLVSAAAGFGLMTWFMVQPAWATVVWWSGASTPELADRAQRAERWFVEPRHWRVRDLLAESHWNWEQAAEAMHWSRTTVEMDPGKSALWIDYARVRMRVTLELGFWPDAIEGVREGFSRACQLEPKLPWTWLESARFERSLGDLNVAAEYARQAVAVEPNFVRGWLFLTRIETDLGQIESARRSFAHALQARNRRFEAFTNYEDELVEAPEWQFAELDSALNRPSPSPLVKLSE